MREQVWQMGKNLAFRLAKDYPLMLSSVMSVLQNDYGFRPANKIEAVEESLNHLRQMKIQLNQEIDAFEASLEKWKND